MADWTERQPEIRNSQRWTAGGIAKARDAAKATPKSTKKTAKKKGGSK